MASQLMHKLCVITYKCIIHYIHDKGSRPRTPFQKGFRFPTASGLENGSHLMREPGKQTKFSENTDALFVDRLPIRIHASFLYFMWSGFY